MSIITHFGWRQRLQMSLYRRMCRNRAKIHPMRQLFWECTLRCNLHCRHCGSDCKTTTLCPDMPAEDFLRAVDTLLPHVDPHQIMVVITGGEPLVRADLAEVGRALRDRGFSWGIVTNGWLLDEQKLRELLAAGMLSLTISLDGLRDDHDWMRGREGCYDRAIRAIRLLCRTRGLTWDVDTCVTRRNYPRLEEMRQVLLAEGVKNWRLLTVFPMGRAASDPEMIITDEEFEGLMLFIAQQRADHEAGRTPLLCYYGCEGFLGEYERKVRPHFYHCDAGISVASVLIDGSISACTSVRSDYHQGNIYRDNLWQVWQERFLVFRDRSWMRKLEPCSDCKLWQYCEGGGMHQRGADNRLMICRCQGVNSKEGES